MSEQVGRGAGGFVGGIANNPGIVAIAAILGVVGLIFVFFREDIRKSLEGFGQIELPEITFPEFPEITFPEFPEFPEFPDFSKIFSDFLITLGGGTPEPEPGEIIPGTDELEPGTIEETPIGPIEIPEGCTVDSLGRVSCPTPPTFDVCDQFPELCEPCGPGETRIGGICQPSEPITPPVEEEITPGLELPPGFVGGGPSFEGGTIFETDDCFLSLNQLIEKYGVSASEAANIKAIACTAEPGFQPTDIPEEFDPGTSTGSGLLPGEERIITGGATLESEEQRAACTSCELFGLNCPICRGEVGA